MSLENVKNFLQAISLDPALSAKVTSAVAGKSPEDATAAVTELARAQGFHFTTQEAAELRQAQPDSEALSEDALNNVAGGVGDSQLGSLTPGASGIWGGVDGTQTCTPGTGFPGQNETKPVNPPSPTDTSTIFQAW